MPNNVPSADERQPALERRLATIMMADVAGYSRMMGENEERTVQMLRGHREVFDALLAAHRGRVFNTAGDAILAEFPSAVEAVRCATEIQSALRTRNEHFPEDERMWFRIGINLGDVIIQGTDLLGDGVNVAARIQTVAQPGGVCISGSVYDQIQNKLTLQFTMLGERSFKNIAQPIRTFSISEADGTTMPSTAAKPAPPKKTWKPAGIVAALSVLLVVAAGSGYWLYRGQEAKRAEALHRTIEAERRAAETQTAKATQERAEAEEAQRQANEARRAAETAQRQARLEAEAQAQAAKAALERAEIEKKRLDQELKRAEAEKRAIEAAASEKVVAKATSAEPPKTVEPPWPASMPAAVPPAKEVEPAARFDGTYEGSLCNERSETQPEKKCWPVLLKVTHGVVSATWTSSVGKPASAQGTVSPDGTVAITLDGWQPSGKPTAASLTGKWENNRISVFGKWRGGRAVTGDWTKGN